MEVAGLAVDAGVCPPIAAGDIIEGDDPDIMGDPDMPGDIIMGDPDMPGDFIIGDPDMGDPDMLLAGALAAAHAYGIKSVFVQACQSVLHPLPVDHHRGGRDTPCTRRPSAATHASGGAIPYLNACCC